MMKSIWAILSLLGDDLIGVNKGGIQGLTCLVNSSSVDSF